MEFNLCEVQEALALRLPERDAIVTPGRTFSWSDLNERTRRLANVLLAAGVSVPAGRGRLADWEAGQDRVAICLHNGHEYLEALLGTMKARAAPCNVNYRYVAGELQQLLNDMAPVAVVYDSRFAPQLEAAVSAIRESGAVDRRPLMLEVGNTSGVQLAGAVAYEEALAGAGANRPAVEWSPDDLYILYTGGTTGKPKGVLWRQADIFVTALGGRNFRRGGREWESLEELVGAAVGRVGARGLSAAPFMHGTGQWVSFQALHTGGAVVIQSIVDRFDAEDVLDTAERESVSLLTIAGEAFAAPLLAALDARQRDLSSLMVLSSSGAALSPKSKQALLTRLPGVRIRDTMGSSEAGPFGDMVGTAGSGGSGAVGFRADAHTCVVDDSRKRILAPGHEGAGWLARSGRIPLGYLNDPVRTAATFPRIDGVRLTVPGDRAVLHADGSLQVLGRDAVTINSGGEKIFAEEVEAAARHHPAVRDVVVVGRPSERWGSEVVAIVEAEPGLAFEDDELLAACAKEIARYKLPKAILRVDRVRRSPAGKVDYAWARAMAEGAVSSTP